MVVNLPENVGLIAVAGRQSHGRGQSVTQRRINLSENTLTLNNRWCVYLLMYDELSSPGLFFAMSLGTHLHVILLL